MRWSVAEGLKKGRQPTADQAARLAAAPDCDTGTLILVGAYAKLSTEKSIGMALGPIPISIIWQWCDRLRLPPEVAAHAENVLRRVDSIILRRERSRSKVK